MEAIYFGACSLRPQPASSCHSPHAVLCGWLHGSPPLSPHASDPSISKTTADMFPGLIGSAAWHGNRGHGKGPWVGADLEAGMYVDS